jgi:molybdenum cofactor biosynthesis enzyme MoaA
MSQSGTTPDRNEHAREYRLLEERVILHGGEPLLAGAVRLASIARDSAIKPLRRLDLRIHTNGVRLALLAQQRDGAQTAHRIPAALEPPDLDFLLPHGM